MKNIYKIQMLLVMLLAMLSGCIEEFGGVGEPFNRTQQVVGSWNISTVTQVDDIAVEKGYPSFVQSVEITNKLPYSDYSINLKSDGTFEVSLGNAPDLLGLTSGTWAFDDGEFPSRIIFTSADESTKTTLDIQGLNALTEEATPTINFQFAKYFLDGSVYKPFLTYNYTMVQSGAE